MEPNQRDPIIRTFTGPDLDDLFAQSMAAEFIGRAFAESLDEDDDKPSAEDDPGSDE